MRRNGDRLVFGDDPPNFFLSMLHYKASELSDVDILSTRQSILHYSEKTFEGSSHIRLVNPSFLGDLHDNFCLGHSLVIF